MQRKRRELTSAPGLLELAGHTAMGAAMGLAFALMLVLIDPADVATLIAHGGSQTTVVVVGALVLIFAIGATLSGAVFSLTEDP